ncbi:MAG: hypothetical protein LBN37_05590, partial [Bacteroidales bacterium]|nr:hypothetical protein [Bacteroidales bacterium]
MNNQEDEIVLKLTGIANQLSSGKRKLNLDIGNIEDIENENIRELAQKIVHLGEQYRDCYGFIMDLANGKLYTEPPRGNPFVDPFKQLHSDLRHLTWQIQEIANGDYDQSVSFSGDFSEA